jgi:hypothetical protein
MTGRLIVARELLILALHLDILGRSDTAQFEGSQF